MDFPIMDRNIRYASTDTLKVSANWSRLSDCERVALVNSVLGVRADVLSGVAKVVDVKSDGQIIIDLIEPLSADKRGALLLNLEQLLKDMIDPGLTIWLAALGDRSSLRNLRGIEMKAQA